MGYEHDTYYFDRHGTMSSSQSPESVLRVNSVEHDTYGRPSYTAAVIELGGAKEALNALRPSRPHKELSAIEDAIRHHERS
jgi:hypothetical protein